MKMKTTTVALVLVIWIIIAPICCAFFHLISRSNVCIGSNQAFNSVGLHHLSAFGRLQVNENFHSSSTRLGYSFANSRPSEFKRDEQNSPKFPCLKTQLFGRISKPTRGIQYPSNFHLGDDPPPRKPKQDVVLVEGKVVETLRGGMFRVQVQQSTQVLLCIISGKIRTKKIRIVLGDEVTCEVSVYDLTKGRIVYRKR